MYIHYLQFTRKLCDTYTSLFTGLQEVSATGRSLIQRSFTEGGVSVCDSATPTVRRRRPGFGCCATDTKIWAATWLEMLVFFVICATVLLELCYLLLYLCTRLVFCDVCFMISCQLLRIILIFVFQWQKYAEHAISRWQFSISHKLFLIQYQRKYSKHVARTEGDRVPSLAFHCHPSGRRDLGRPKQRWKDEGYLEDQEEHTLLDMNPNSSCWKWWWWSWW